MSNALSALELTRQGLPDCFYKEGLHTSSSAIHKDKIYTGNFARWETFKDEVWRTVQESNLETCPQPLAYGEVGLDKANNLLREHYRCGEEISVSGRFVQNALHVISAVGKAKGFGSVFGDWKASRTSKGVQPMDEIDLPAPDADVDDDITKHKQWIIRKALANLIPDYCLIDKDDHARVVGEAKVPWRHSFESWWDFYISGQEDFMRQALGQIAYYMQNANLKYGFLTNYAYTFFLKQETVGEAVHLFCSPPIPHNEAGSNTSVSVRQCLFYLLTKAEDRSEYFLHNDSKTWVVKRGSEESKESFEKRIKEARSKERALGNNPESETKDDELSGQLANMGIRDSTRPTAESSKPRRSNRRVQIDG